VPKAPQSSPDATSETAYADFACAPRHKCLRNGGKMEIVKGAVENLIVYLILVTVLMNLVKTSSFLKYLELFTGLVLILLLFTPVVRLFSKENVLENFLDANEFLYQSSDEAEFLYDANESSWAAVLELYLKKIEEYLSLLGEKNEITIKDVEIKVSPAEEGFGTVEEIKVEILEEEKIEEFKNLLMEEFSLPENKVEVN
jgi:stage III sporulation protein AF